MTCVISVENACDRPAQPTVFLLCGLLKTKICLSKWVTFSSLPTPKCPTLCMFCTIPCQGQQPFWGHGDDRHSMLSCLYSYNSSLQYWRRPQVCWCSASAHESIQLSAGLLWSTGVLHLETSQLFLSSSDSTVTVHCHPYIIDMRERFSIASCN